jgi:ABC-2 type transport system ATP-binding protein/ribosome-dependent ATPase
VSAVEVNQVTKRFGDFVAVSEVDLEVEPGEVVGLLGANGAGKTTLIRMVLGLLAPTAGRIRLFGMPHSREQRGRIGYVPQNLGLYRDLTAAENLEFRARAFGAATRGAGQVGGDSLIRDLPLGVQRRSAFAAATQHSPELLVLDEPTSGVSPRARAELWDLIRERAESGTAVLVSTHYMDEAEQADRLVLMNDGRIAARGSVADIVGTTEVVEVVADQWSEAFSLLDRDQRLIALSGTSIRVIAESAAAIEAELASAGLAAVVGTVPATLDETMVALQS